MPAWCAKQYPDTLALQKDGTRITWGIRKNNCFSNKKYRSLSKKITTAMADRFAHNKNVIGWQTDNEFGHPFCYCADCKTEFQLWLKDKYESLQELNRAWGTHFWNQQFSEWDEITIPMAPSLYTAEQ